MSDEVAELTEVADDNDPSWPGAYAVRRRLKLPWFPRDRLTVTQETRFGLLDRLRILFGAKVRTTSVFWTREVMPSHVFDPDISSTEVVTRAFSVPRPSAT